LRRQPSTARDKLIVFDPALQGYHGHHLEFARLIKSELATAFDIRFYGSFWARTGIVAELGLRPVCYDSVYPPRGDFASVNEAQTASLLAALQKIDIDELTPRTTFFMHTLTVHQLTGLAAWISALPLERRPTMLLQFQFPLEFGLDQAADVPAAVAAARQATDVLVASGNVIFMTNSDLLAEQLHMQLGQTCRLLPVPVVWPAEAFDTPRLDEPMFGFFGGLRVEKGSKILAGALPQFVQRYSDTHFIVHASYGESDEVAASQLAQLPNVEVIRKTFATKAQYFQEINRAHALLLPYDPGAYAVRTSGIFLEALGIGRPVITTDGTWMAHQLRGQPERGMIMPSYSAEALLNCLEAARRKILQRRWQPTPNSEITARHNQRMFCNMLVEAIGGERVTAGHGNGRDESGAITYTDAVRWENVH
jgi:glycosyltransferase involved in cell wall biosynthesis